LWQDITAAKNLVAFHSDSLIHDLTNNHVESYNSIVAKFVGGKRVNYSLRGSYNTRCMTAVSSFNFGPEYMRKLHKTATKVSPGKFTKRFIKKLQRKKEVTLSRKKTKLNFGQSTKPTQSKRFTGADKDYGDLDELGCVELETSQEDLEAKKNYILTNLKCNLQEIRELERNTIDQGKCDTWHKERKNRLTASNFGKVCKLRKSTPRTNTVKYILYAEDLTLRSPAMTYGIQYEPMAKEAFELKFNLNVLPAGLFIDKQYNFLAGSPDGLVGDNDIVEIKCPHSSKDMTPYEGVIAKKIKYLVLNDNGDLKLNKNHNYHYQVQGQLRVANKNSCYFVVWTPKDMFVERIMRDGDFWRDKMETQLVDFYNNYLIKEIIDPKILK